MAKNKSILRQLAIVPIIFYRYFIRPILGQHCRFHPSCSTYACDSITTHGIVKGFYLTITRLLRCHPWAQGGIDPVPNYREK